MKKFFALVLALAFASPLSVFAAGGTGEGTAAPQRSEAPAVVVEQPADEAAEAPETEAVVTSEVTEVAAVAAVAAPAVAQQQGFFARVAGKLQTKLVKLYDRLANKADGSVAAAIILCFFFGGLGIHRVVMGGKGTLILLYFITCGGIFGILPLIDFIRLIINADHYRNNNSFFAAFQ
jgi:TM2 domain-containing membrane protein YozV